MALVHILLLFFGFLGVSLGPLLLAVAIRAYGEERSRSLAEWSIGMGLRSVYRPALTFATNDELTLKRRSYDEQHDSEYIKFGGLFSGVKRHLSDPAERMHSLYGVPFGFVDELFGLVCDPRDSAIGAKIHHAQTNSQYEYRVERGDQLKESVLAVFDMPEGHHGVHLPDVERLVGGMVDSQIINWIRDLYEESQAPKASTTALRQLLVPVGTLIAIVLMGMFVAGQSGAGGGGGGGGGGRTIGVGSSLLVLLLSTSDPRAFVRGVNWRNLFVSLGFAAVALLLAFGLFIVFPFPLGLGGIVLPVGIWAVIAMGIGLGVLPFMAFWLGRSLGEVGMLLGKLFIVIGLLGFKRPVITLDDEEYRIVEYDEDEWEVEPAWYRFALARLGVDFVNTEENWPDGTTLSRAMVEEMANPAVADGGEVEAAQRRRLRRRAPTGHTATELIALDDILGFVPNDPPENSVFVRTDRTTGWMFEAGQDRRLMLAALQRAKQEFGGGRKPVSDKWILGATALMAIVGLVFDWVVFF